MSAPRKAHPGRVSADELVDTLLLAAKEERPPSAPQRLWRWLVHRGLAWRRRAAAFEIRIKPTPRALLRPSPSQPNTEAIRLDGNPRDPNFSQGF